MKTLNCLLLTTVTGTLLASPGASAQTIVPAGSADLLIDGPASAAFAESVAIVPDLDGDGLDDIAVGAIAADPISSGGSPLNNAGAVLVHSSATGALIRAFEGTEADGNLGFGTIVLPDRNGDGVYELAAGAPRMSNGLDTEAGAVVIFSGASGAVLDTILGDNGPGTLLGSSLALVGDLNGDGVPEFVAGASGVGSAGPVSPGYAVVYDGATLAELHTFTGEEGGSIFGASIAGGSDLDGDGTPDIVVGAPLQDVSVGGGTTYIDAGRIYVFSGATFGLVRRAYHAAGPSDTQYANFGTSVAVLGDLDGDGAADYAAGGPEGQQGSGGNGFVAVYSGMTGAIIHDIEGPFATGEQHGGRVTALGDVDGDGTLDFAASSSQTCFGFCGSGPGAVIVYSGATGTALTVFEGESNGDNFGGALVAGDLNGDGGTDLVAGAPFHGSGRVYLFLGTPTNDCPADLDDDGNVGFTDLNAVLSAWGPCAGCPEDLDDDDNVGFTDLNTLLSAWGACL